MKLQITQKQLCQILSGTLHVQVESVEIVDKPAVSENSHNPNKLTPKQYGAAKGYRLLDEDEIKDRQTPYNKIEIWLRDFGWSRCCFGSSKLQTFRTKLSREELAKLI